MEDKTQLVNRKYIKEIKKYTYKKELTVNI